MKIHIIMPVGADPNYKLKKQAIVTSVSTPGIIYHFPDYCQIQPVFDLQETLKDLESSSFVLTDLSQERPSCYYELGLAQAIGKKIYLVAEEGTPIHQACDREHVNFYRNLKELGVFVSDLIKTELHKEKANETLTADAKKPRG
jgi:hypothetical protein